MAGYNRTVLVGNLTRDPEYKQLASGQAVCRLGLAVNRQYKNRQTGESVQEVCFIDVDVWGAQAESCRQYLQKGRQVLVEGRLKLDTWEDPSSGQNRSKHSIVADRVVFLSVGSNEESLSSGVGSQSEVEKDLMDQLDQMKAREASKAKPATKAKVSKENFDGNVQSSNGEIAFKDEQPFTDDLPF